MLGDIIYSADKKSISSPLSAYQPSEEVRELTWMVKMAYQDGEAIQNTPFKEFNNKSVLQRENEDKMAWLSWNPEPYVGEDDWRWNGVRPITRNRVISTAAHLTSQLLIPNIFAQNQFDEEDREAAYVMKDLIEYNIKRSNYETAFLFGVISGLVSPVTYFKVDYVKAYQDVWQEGKIEKVVDDMFSGFQNSLVPVDEVLISNAYQYDIQKQDWLIHKKYISYGEAEAKYGNYSLFKYVQAGKKVILNDDGQFYDVEDINDSLVEEVCFKNRRKDTEVYFVGGVYMGNDNTEFNPFIHRTNKNKPKYNLVKFGYEPIDAMRFFYYKSLVAKMSNDQEAVDREWQMYFDASFLSTFPPTISMGAGKIDRSVIAPATNTEIGKDAKITPLNVSNPGAALNALREAERSLTESSQDPQMSGDKQGPSKTARESILLQQNAQTQLGIASKMIGFMVKDIGSLLVDDIIRYQSIGEMNEITSEMSYKTFIIDGKVKGGKDKSSYIKFTDRFAGKSMTKEEKDTENYKLAEEAEEEKEIYEVNPYVFSKMDYLITIDADKALQKNDAFERAFKLETYDRAIANPLVQQDLEAQQKITRDFLFEPLMKGEASKYLPNIEKVASSLIPTEGNGSDLPSRITKSAAMENLVVN
jgi:hypothetical protein